MTVDVFKLIHVFNLFRVQQFIKKSRRVFPAAQTRTNTHKHTQTHSTSEHRVFHTRPQSVGTSWNQNYVTTNTLRPPHAYSWPDTVILSVTPPHRGGQTDEVGLWRDKRTRHKPYGTAAGMVGGVPHLRRTDVWLDDIRADRYASDCRSRSADINRRLSVESELFRIACTGASRR